MKLTVYLTHNFSFVPPPAAAVGCCYSQWPLGVSSVTQKQGQLSVVKVKMKLLFSYLFFFFFLFQGALNNLSAKLCKIIPEYQQAVTVCTTIAFTTVNISDHIQRFKKKKKKDTSTSSCERFVMKITLASQVITQTAKLTLPSSHCCWPQTDNLIGV